MITKNDKKEDEMTLFIWLRKNIYFILLISLLTACGSDNTSTSSTQAPLKDTTTIDLSVNPNDPLIFTYIKNDIKVNAYGKKAVDGSAVEIDLLQVYAADSTGNFDTIHIDKTLNKYKIELSSGDVFIAEKTSLNKYYIEFRSNDGTQVEVSEIDLSKENKLLAAKSLTKDISVKTRQGYIYTESSYSPLLIRKNQKGSGYFNKAVDIGDEYLYMNVQSCDNPVEFSSTVFSLISKGSVSRYYAMEQISPGKYKSTYPVVTSEFTPTMQAVEYADKLSGLDYFNECAPTPDDSLQLDDVLKKSSVVFSKLFKRVAIAADAHKVTKCLMYDEFKAGQYYLNELITGSYEREVLDVNFVVKYSGRLYNMNTKWEPGKEPIKNILDIRSDPAILLVELPREGVLPNTDYTVKTSFICSTNEKYFMSISGTDGYTDRITGVSSGDYNDVITLTVPGAEVGVVDTIDVTIYNREIKSDTQISTVKFRN